MTREQRIIICIINNNNTYEYIFQHIHFNYDRLKKKILFVHSRDDSTYVRIGKKIHLIIYLQPVFFIFSFFFFLLLRFGSTLLLEHMSARAFGRFTI